MCVCVCVCVCVYIYIYIYIYTYRLINLVGRVFANAPGDRGSNPGRVIPKTLKMVLDTSLLNTKKYKVRIKGKMEPSKESSCALPKPQFSSYRKGSLLVVLDYCRQLYLYIYIYINAPVLVGWVWFYDFCHH